MPRAAVRIGVISDSHGYLDPGLFRVFDGVDHIIHAGDIGHRDILAALSAIAPVTAVAGNLDKGRLADELPSEALGQVGDTRFVVAHKPKRLLKRLQSGAIGEDGSLDLVVWGHVHAPSVSWVDGVIHLNPGTSTSPYEEDDGPTVAIVESTPPWGLSVHFVPLQRRPPRTSSD